MWHVLSDPAPCHKECHVTYDPTVHFMSKVCDTFCPQLCRSARAIKLRGSQGPRRYSGPSLDIIPLVPPVASSFAVGGKGDGESGESGDGSSRGGCRLGGSWRRHRPSHALYPRRLSTSAPSFKQICKMIFHGPPRLSATPTLPSLAQGVSVWGRG